MSRNRIPAFHFFVLVFVLTLPALTAFAQVGKISAKITDAKTGEPLYRATMKIVETGKGTYSNDQGVATISNIRPDENYTVEAKYANYEPFTIKGVKVTSDQTTKLVFKLSSKHQDTIIISAERLVDPTRVDIGQKLSTKEIVTTAALNNISQIAITAPGVMYDGSNHGVSIHGSKGSQNSERMNGIETMNPVSGAESISQVALSKFALAEVAVGTGGLGAAYGNTTGGAISSTTRAGSGDFEFMARIRTDLPSLNGYSGNGYKLQAVGDQTYELAFGGPISEDVKFFITAKGESFQHYDAGSLTPFDYTGSGLGVIDPAGNNLGQLAYDHRYVRSATGNLSFNILGFQMTADAVLSSINRQYNSWSDMYGDPAELQARDLIDNIYTLRGNLGVGNTGIVKLIAGYEASSDYIGKYDQSAGGGLFSMYQMYQANDNFSYNENTHTLIPGADGLVDIYTPVSRQIADPSNPANVRTLPGAGINPFTGHIEGDGIIFSTHNPYGMTNSNNDQTFTIAGNVGGFRNQVINHYQFETHYSDQFGSHGVDAGVELHVYNIFNYDNQQPWDANPFRDSFTVTPVVAGAYIQDKMEFSDITFQPGLRLDVYQPNNNHVLVDPLNPLKVLPPDSNGISKKVGNFKSAPTEALLSPRLGITYAVSDKTIFNFNYGIYFDKPTFSQVLTATYGDFNQALIRSGNIIGNGGLKGETDEMISVGFTTGLSDVLSLTVNGIYKKMKNITGIAQIISPVVSQAYYYYTDDEYGNYKGIELSLDKRLSDNFSARLNYTYSVALGTASTATTNYSAFTNQSSDAEAAILPLQAFPLDFDRTHVAQLLLSLLYGKGEGPKIGGTAILENFNFSTKTIYESGNPYTAFDIRGTQVGEHNGERQPNFMQTDFTITRNIPLSDVFGAGIGHSWLELQLEVSNLFNQVNAVTVYNTSGLGDDDGKTTPYNYSQDYVNDPTIPNQLDALGLLLYNPLWDLNHDGRVDINEQQQGFKRERVDKFAQRTNYQLPRHFYLNFALHF